MNKLLVFLFALVLIVFGHYNDGPFCNGKPVSHLCFVADNRKPSSQFNFDNKTKL